MLERTRLAVRRLLTMANLFENLHEAYGEGEALAAREPLGYRLFPSATLTFADCLRFSNLAAEAFIRELDLKKGERVLLMIPEPVELLLASVSLMKAGGIAVPLPYGLSGEEASRRAAGCGATLAVVDGRLLAERPGLSRCMPGVERVMASGPRSRAPEGVPSLDAALDASSGFFLPYTLKPGSVVGLFHTRMRDASLKAVMATNEMILGTRRLFAPWALCGPGRRFLSALSPVGTGGFATAVAALLAGIRVAFTAEGDTGPLAAALASERPHVFAASPEQYSRLLQAGGVGAGARGVWLWLCWGYGLAREEVAELGTSGGGERPVPAPVVEIGDVDGNAAMLALKLSFRGWIWPREGRGMVIPPNRVRTGGGEGAGERQARVLAARGPAVTPGYWNDLEGTLSAKRDGWLYLPTR
ncbi:MAG: acyl--CoA ligase [Actinobacteria bacterium]|nr:acyl--CoA ligase [Actinomycetota bacterium]